MDCEPPDQSLIRVRGDVVYERRQYSRLPCSVSCRVSKHRAIKTKHIQRRRPSERYCHSGDRVNPEPFQARVRAISYSLKYLTLPYLTSPRRLRYIVTIPYMTHLLAVFKKGKSVLHYIT